MSWPSVTALFLGFGCLLGIWRLGGGLGLICARLERRLLRDAPLLGGGLNLLGGRVGEFGLRLLGGGVRLGRRAGFGVLGHVRLRRCLLGLSVLGHVRLRRCLRGLGVLSDICQRRGLGELGVAFRRG